MTDQKPSVGRIVHYTLGEFDPAVIDQQSPEVVDMQRVRNSVQAGEVYPAVIVRVFTGDCVNLRVLLDGRADYWATSRALDNPEIAATRYSPNPDHEGPGYAGGTWHWPERV